MAQASWVLMQVGPQRDQSHPIGHEEVHMPQGKEE
jgi:hypothetical protein